MHLSNAAQLLVQLSSTAGPAVQYCWSSCPVLLAQLSAFESCPLEAAAPDGQPQPKPKLLKPEPKAPDVFAIPAQQYSIVVTVPIP